MDKAGAAMIALLGGSVTHYDVVILTGNTAALPVMCSLSLAIRRHGAKPVGRFHPTRFNAGYAR